MAKAIRVLLVCSQEYCDRFAGILLIHGCTVDSFTDYDHVMAMPTVRHYDQNDVVIIDTTMPDASGQPNPKAGVEFMRHLRKAGVRAGIVLLTDHTFMMPLLRKAQEIGHSGILSKNQQLGVMHPRLGADVLYRAVAEAAKTNVPEQVVKDILAKNPFAVSWDEYEKLDSRAIDALQRKAHQLNDQWADKERQRLGADWVLLCGDSEFSGCMQKLLSIEWLEALGYHHNRVPFLFIHPPDIEEVRLIPTASQPCPAPA